ncbi:MAG: M15 family metallopeptidase [Porticoccaceae bacterium]
MSDRAISLEYLSGQTTQHLVCVENNVFLHRDVAPAFARLRAAAAREDIDLVIASGFRAFERQLLIWNDKAQGRRPVLDVHSRPMDITALTDEELVFAILRWSALPGASRHHWGTDMDVWDRAAVAPGYALQLVPGEYAVDGPFARLGRWLASPAVADLGFARPYCGERGGVAPEPWHLSYLPVAQRFAWCLDVDALAQVVTACDMALKDAVLANLDDIHERFVVGVY